MARVFTLEQYGTLAGVGAWFAIISQAVGLGMGTVLMREVARGDPSRSRLNLVRWRYAVSGLLLLLLAAPVSLAVFGGQMPWLALLTIAATELLVAPLLLPQVYWLLGAERVGQASFLQTLPALMRLSAVGVVYIMGQADLLSYALVNLFLMLVGTFLVLRQFTATDAVAAEPLPWRTGLPYAYNAGVSVFAAESDKAILLSSLGPTIAGGYSAAWRVAQAAMTPVNALVLSAAARQFRAGASGQTPPTTRFYVRIALSYGVLAATAAWFAAPCLPLLLGEEFSQSVDMLRALTPWIVISGVRQVLVSVLTASNAQTWRNVLETFAAIAGALLNFCLLPVFGWIVAALSIAVLESVIVIAIVLKLSRNRS